MVPSWYFDIEMVYCPCCRRKVPIKLWQGLLVDHVLGYLPAWTKQPPSRVICVDQHGRAVKEGYARTYRCHTGLVDNGVMPKPEGWKGGWWWPLHRVLWIPDSEVRHTGEEC